MGLFNRYIFVNDNKAVRDAAHIAAKASREHDETIKGISEVEIKSKDRVDISLEEYELLKKENRELLYRCFNAEMVLDKIHIHPKIIDRIDPDSIQKYESKSLMGFKTRVCIEFDVHDYDIKDI